jgi:transcriptional regulator with PAS, ATPase and Fis domain
MNEVERCLITSVLEKTNHNYVVAARLLGISRSRLYRRIERLEIEER